MTVNKEQFARSPVAARVYELLIRAAIERLAQRNGPKAPLPVVDSATGAQRPR